MPNYKPSKKTEPKVQETGINRFFISLITVIGTIVPFIHIVFPNGYMPDVFGYNDLETFLFAIGMPISILMIGISLLLFSGLIEERLRYFIRNTAFTSIFTGSFFIIWSLWYTKDLPPILYYLSLTVIALIVTLSFRWFFIKENHLRDKLKTAIGFIFETKNETIPNLALKGLKKAEKSEILKVANKHEEDFKTVVKKLAE